MLLGKIFERFANGSPLTVMLRGTLEYALRPEALDQLFAHTARRQYTHKLLFSTLVDLTSLVVCRVQRPHHAAYQADPARVGASLKALYDKLDHTEPAVSAALVQHTGATDPRAATTSRPACRPACRVTACASWMATTWPPRSTGSSRCGGCGAALCPG